MEAQRELELRGIGASPGIATGRSCCSGRTTIPYPTTRSPPTRFRGRCSAWEAALLETRRQLHDIQTRVGEVLGSDSAGIFEAHLQVVDDPSFVDEVYREVRAKRRNVERILPTWPSDTPGPCSRWTTTICANEPRTSAM